MPSRSTRAEVEEQIATAFAGAEMPGSVDEITTGGIDGPYVVEHFLGRHQADVAASFLPSLHMEDFSYMTVKAVAYYLPVVLRLMMKTPYDSDLWIHLYGFLAPSRHGRLRSGVGELEPEQLQAISAWANYLYDEWQTTPPLWIDVDEALTLAVAYRQPHQQ